MRINFGDSDRATIGIEWEFAVVDATTFEQVPKAEVCLGQVADPVTGPIRREYFNSMIELVSSVHATVPAALVEIEQFLHTVLDFLEPQGLTLLGAGTHPFGDPSQQEPVNKAQYRRVMERNGWWGRQMAINGLHIHCGIDERSKALPIVYGMARFAPYFIALSASSPYWLGQDTGFASQRTMLFQQLPTNGLPYYMESWEALEAFASQLEQVDMIHNPSEIRWDVRPSEWGTVENRTMDSVPTLFEVGALAALSQCLTEQMSRKLDEGESIERLPDWFMRENKWRAARYGISAEIITSGNHEYLIPATDGIMGWVNDLLPIAEDLGCAEELERIPLLIEEGPSYLRQRRLAAAQEDTIAVTRSLVDELRRGRPTLGGKHETIPASEHPARK